MVMTRAVIHPFQSEARIAVLAQQLPRPGIPQPPGYRRRGLHVRQQSEAAG